MSFAFKNKSVLVYCIWKLNSWNDKEHSLDNKQVWLANIKFMTF